jgi:hypothetical protein
MTTTTTTDLMTTRTLSHRGGADVMVTEPDTVIQDLQGAIGLGDRAGLTAEKEAWRAHPLHVSKTDPTASPTRERGTIAALAGEAQETVDGLDPLLQRLTP